MRKILSIGNTCLDIVLRYAEDLPKWSTEQFFDEAQWRLGGQGVNFAIATRALGHDTYLVSSVGNDSEGSCLRSELESVPLLNTQFLHSEPCETGFSVSVAGVNNERFFLTSRGHQNNFRLSRFSTQIAGLTEPNDLVHISGYYMLPNLKGELPQFLDDIRKRGAKISFDPGWAPNGFSQSERADLSLLLSKVDYFEPNETEILAITRTKNVQLAAKKLSSQYSGLAAIKLGEGGCMIISNGEMIKEKAFKISIVDTTGAGDAFDAGFLSGVIKGETRRESARFGNATAGLTITRSGDARTRFPDRSEVNAFLKLADRSRTR